MLLSRRLARGAMLTALGVVMLYLASYLPTARLGICAVAGVPVALQVISGGMKRGAFVYVASGLVAAIVLPQKELAALYGLVFGAYPLVKSFAERIPGRWKMWAVKLSFLNIAAAVLFFFMRELLPDIFLQRLVFFLLGGNVLFVLYDIALSGVITLAVRKLGRFLHD